MGVLVDAFSRTVGVICAQKLVMVHRDSTLGILGVLLDKVKKMGRKVDFGMT